MSDSLKEAFSGLGDGEFKDRVCDQFEEELKDETLMGESLGIPDVGTSIRKYTHGQADSTQVTEYGVRLVFDPETVELASLEEGGAVRTEIEELAEQTISTPIKELDLSLVTESEYELWVILDADSL